MILLVKKFQAVNLYKRGEFNPSYTFQYVEEFGYTLNIHTIRQDAITNEITSKLLETYQIYKADENAKENLVAWRENNVKKASASSDEYEITIFSELPCIDNKYPKIQENPVLIAINNDGVSKHAYYYAYFDFGTPFILGYKPGHDMACNIHLPIDTITQLNNK